MFKIYDENIAFYSESFGGPTAMLGSGGQTRYYLAVYPAR